MTFIPSSNWQNVVGSASRRCSCGTWKQHWLNFSNRMWPMSCSVYGCTSPVILGAHVRNNLVDGEYIVPMCASCNGRVTPFTLRLNTFIVPANKSITCGR
jgi:hypothetical protein